LDSTSLPPGVLRLYDGGYVTVTPDRPDPGLLDWHGAEMFRR
jgi:hypothetical protein